MNPLQQIEIKIQQERQQHENMRRRLWVNAWCAIASCWNATDKESPAIWADKALKEFDARFPKPDAEVLNKLKEMAFKTRV